MSQPQYRIAASARWSKAHISQFAIKLIDGKDDAVIDCLREKKNKTDYIRGLIKRDMKKKGKR